MPETSAEQRAELERLAKEATPTPWQAGLDMPGVANNDPRSNILWHGSECVTVVTSPWKSKAAHCANAAYIAAAVNAMPALLRDLAAGDRFKAFVHSCLDQHGVPADDPDNQHSKEGCRIGARLDMLFAERDAATAQAAALRIVLEKHLAYHQAVAGKVPDQKTSSGFIGEAQAVLSQPGPGRECLDRLAAAESERDALRVEFAAEVKASADMLAQRDRLVELLRLLEWHGRFTTFDSDGRNCPCCDWASHEGHAADCELDAALKETPHA